MNKLARFIRLKNKNYVLIDAAHFLKQKLGGSWRFVKVGKKILHKSSTRFISSRNIFWGGVYVY